MKQVITCLLILVCSFTTVFISTSKAQVVSTKAKHSNEDIPDKISALYKWWNLLHYTIEITPDYTTKSIVGTNKIKFTALQTDSTMQIALQDPMLITSINWKNSALNFKKNKNNYTITFPRHIRKGETQSITIHFEGEPKESLKPPYDNGWIWAKDLNGRPFISVACEGSGASIWLPCKEVLYDEPDNGVFFSITVPDTLTAIANGRLKKRSTGKQGTTTYTWEVLNPINNYNIIPYIGKYVTWHKSYAGIKGKLDCDYWVLDYNLTKAISHFKQTDTMLGAFEYWAGPYPFYEDGYKLIEAPMAGMEHQSALAYGNGFQNGLNGKDLISKSGWGLKFDFILVHESGHEWFGNSITCSDGGHSWIHEGFTKYLETLYTSYVFGIQAGNEYAVGTWKRIKNDEPVLGTNTTDQYYKGSAMLHMIRQITGDTLFKEVLTGLSKEFYHQTVNTDKILSFLNNCTKKDFTKIFDQYLTTINIPELEYTLHNNIMEYRWANCVENFDMPLKITLNNKTHSFIYPTTSWQKLSVDNSSENSLTVDNNFYISVKELRPQDR